MPKRSVLAVSPAVLEDLRRIKNVGGHSSLDSVLRTLILEHTMKEKENEGEMGK